MPGLLSRFTSDTDGQESSGEPTRPQASQRRSSVKVYGLIAFNALLALVVGILLRLQEFGYGTLFIVFFISFLIFQALVLREVKEGIIASSCSALGLLLPFLGTSFLYWSAVFGLVWLTLAHAHNRGRQHMNNMMKIKFGQAARPVLGAALMVVVLMMTFVLFIGGQSLIREESIGRFIDIMITPVARGYVEGFSSEATTRDLLDQASRERISQVPEVDRLSSNQREALVAQSTKELAQYIEDNLGFALDLDDTVAGNVQLFLTEKAQGFSGPRAPLGALVLFGILLLLVKGIELILYVPLALLAYLLYELSIAFGFLTVQFESTNKEVARLV